MKKIIFLFTISLFLVSCHSHDFFKVQGTVTGAKGEKIYIEHNSLTKVIPLDSVKLSSKESFSFKIHRPEYPDFYRLRLNNQFIVFAVDSCEEITIHADSKSFTKNYTITGSEPSKQIQQLHLSLMKIQEKINTLSSNLPPERKDSFISEIKNDIEKHKELAKNIIFQNPRSTAAYYALFQKLNNTYLFSPYVKEDRPYCAAVATSYHTFMPEYERSKNLYALVMDAITKERKAIKNEEWEKVLEKNGKGYIDIVLKDSKDKIRKLSELEGKVVLIDFSTYETKESIEYTFTLRDLYNKYHSRGFEIYQVSLDQNKDRWKQAVENIPWICVRDENGSQTPYVLSYNVTSIPTNFLMNKKGEIIARDLDFKQLNQMIDNLL